jgi:ribosome-associated toxin RatA of RatAB toxin-antitoxin module
MTKNILLLLTFVSIASGVMCQGEWKIRKDKNGVVVYTRSSEGQDFDEFKATTTLDFSIATFVNVVRDVEAYPGWITDLRHSQILVRKGDTVQIYYSELKVPFPFGNRDVIYSNKFMLDSTNQSMTITIEALPNYIEKKEGLVRMPYGNGKWEAQSVGENQISVTLQMQINPGGNIPAWLVNRFVSDSPYQTLKNLKSFGKKEKYRAP